MIRVMHQIYPSSVLFLSASYQALTVPLIHPFPPSPQSLPLQPLSSPPPKSHHFRPFSPTNSPASSRPSKLSPSSHIPPFHVHSHTDPRTRSHPCPSALLPTSARW